MFVEGPLSNAGSAFAASLGYFNIWIILLLAWTADFTGDIFYFYVGRWLKRGKHSKILKFLKIKESHIDSINHKIVNNAKKTITGIKLSPIMAGVGLVIVGMTNISIRRFLLISLIVTIPRGLMFTALGFFYGYSFDKIYQYYTFGTYFIFISIVVLILLVYLFRKLFLKTEEKILEELD